MHANICHGNSYNFVKMQVIKMLGIDDPQIWLAYVLCFLSAIGCIVYGALKWNEGKEEEVC